jgi:hypothetical protein
MFCSELSLRNQNLSLRTVAGPSQLLKILNSKGGGGKKIFGVILRQNFFFLRTLPLTLGRACAAFRTMPDCFWQRCDALTFEDLLSVVQSSPLVSNPTMSFFHLGGVD